MGVGTVEAAAEAQTISGSPGASFNKARLRHLASNVGLALLFFASLKSGFSHSGTSLYGSELATWIWIAGAVLMGLLSLVRVPPTTSMITVSSIVSTAAMMIAPTLIRPITQSTGLLFDCAVVIELVGVVLGQASRLYLGRSFGLLPANRGIVSGGPFALMRHPIYVGWFILASGYAMAFPSWWNLMWILVTLPFMMWRIRLEEQLLTQDPEYRAYCRQTPYKLVPGLF
jgi:protein-S-isoprenylcysteine O-methyltransferase Ste14